MQKHHRTFLHRFTPSGAQAGDEVDSVIRNLTAILNTKQGFGSVIGSFGIGGYLAKQGAHESVAVLTQEIEDSIRNYEPRLEDFDLKLIGKNRDMELMFEVVGKVGGKRQKFRLLFHTTFGNFEVEKVGM